MHNSQWSTHALAITVATFLIVGADASSSYVDTHETLHAIETDLVVPEQMHAKEESLLQDAFDSDSQVDQSNHEETSRSQEPSILEEVEDPDSKGAAPPQAKSGSKTAAQIPEEDGPDRSIIAAENAATVTRMKHEETDGKFLQTSQDDRRRYFWMAKLAENMKRYSMMFGSMIKVVQSASENYPLTHDEREKLEQAFAKLIGEREFSLRVAKSVQIKVKGNDEERYAQDAVDQIHREITGLCTHLIKLQEKYPGRCQDKSGADAYVQFQGLMADANRYLAEISTGEDKTEYTNGAKSHYGEAMACAKDTLAVTHPVRLKVALSFAVFLYDVVKNHNDATVMAKSAFDDAIAELDNLPEDMYKQTTSIMHLLRDHLALWVSGADSGEP